MSRDIDNTQDMIDSRDIIARIEELQDFQESEGLMNTDALEELRVLLVVQSEAERSPDWQHGESLIRESYFTDYIEQLIDDCYEMPKELKSGDWPWRHVTVDYEAAAEEAKQDYTDIDFDGVTFLIRA